MDNSPAQAGTEALADLESVCADIFARWDADQRSGKLLTALQGRVTGYDPRVDRIRAALRQQPQPQPSGRANDHAWNCEWHLDQYPHECTCGAIRQPSDTSASRTAGVGREQLINALKRKADEVNAGVSHPLRRCPLSHEQAADAVLALLQQDGASPPAATAGSEAVVERICRAVCEVRGVDTDRPTYEGAEWTYYADAVSAAIWPDHFAGPDKMMEPTQPDRPGERERRAEALSELAAGDAVLLGRPGEREGVS